MCIWMLCWMGMWYTCGTVLIRLCSHVPSNVSLTRTGSKLGITPLMLAAMNGHTAAVKLLLDHGSDINAQVLSLVIPYYLKFNRYNNESDYFGHCLLWLKHVTVFAIQVSEVRSACARPLHKQKPTYNMVCSVALHEFLISSRTLHSNERWKMTKSSLCCFSSSSPCWRSPFLQGWL